MKQWVTAVLGVFAITTGALAAQADGVFETLQAHCGKAFEGRVVKGADDDPWRKANLVMHIRECSPTQIKVPLHYDDNRSRIWVITRHADGSVSLKHDHRHADGNADKITQYGGLTEGTDGAPGDTDIAFPVDDQSIALFMNEGLNASLKNSWHMSVEGDDFIYRLTRPPYDGTGRDFRVGFDLTKPVATPPPAWDLVK